MSSIRILFLAVLLPIYALPARAGEDAEDWRLIGGMLALMQQFVHLAAHSPDPAAAQKGVDAMLSGAHPEANRLASGLMNEILLDVPAQHRGAFVSIGKDLLVLARREQARAAAQAAAGTAGETKDAGREAALQARKELYAMGLRYWDEQQFNEAVRRGDRLAVDLYLAARGLESRSPQPAR